jgi:predicted RNase H-like HicB family nuclease
MRPKFPIQIECDEDGFFVGEVPELRGCYAQGRTLSEMLENMLEAVELCLEEEEHFPAG